MKNPLPWLFLLTMSPLLVSCRSEPSEPPLTAEQADRKELLRQPKEEWKPGAKARKLNILLLAERSKIRKGELFGYRLEMQNVGREPLAFKESAPSFTKDGSLCGEGAAFRFYATPPKGRERVLPCRPAESAEVRPSTAPARPPASGLELILRPGEYLLTRGSAPGKPFRPLETAMTFGDLGTYRLKAVYAAPDGFRSESNTVEVEVVP